jgi:glycosyltransferase involved in cell wall biosynthesis
VANLLIFNLAMDADESALAFVITWVEQLAPHYERIDVITMRAGRMSVPPNVHVHSVGKERGWSEPRRGLEFYRLLIARLRERRYAACFAHMMPLFAVLGAPLLRLWRVPLTLWYTHQQRSPMLRAALIMSRTVVSAARESFPYRTRKLQAIGHGIDTDFFSPGPPSTTNGSYPARYIVQVARIAPIKRQAVLLQAFIRLNDPTTRLVLVGEVLGEGATNALYRKELELTAERAGVANRVIFTGRQSPVQVRDWYRRAAIAVNLSPVGLFDKAVLESLACGLPTVVSNPAFATVYGTKRLVLFLAPIDSIPEDASRQAEMLAQRLRATLDQRPAVLAALRAELRLAVVRGHSMEHLIRKLRPILTDGTP